MDILELAMRCKKMSLMFLTVVFWQGCHSLSQKIFPEFFVILKSSCKALKVLNKHLRLNKINFPEQNIVPNWLNLILNQAKNFSENFKTLKLCWIF